VIPVTVTVTLTDRGTLRLPAAVAEACFGAAPSVLVARRGDELHLVALGPRAVGGLILKQCTLAGDRAVLVVEHLPGTWDAGERTAIWDPDERTLRVPVRLGTPAAAGGEGSADRDAGAGTTRMTGTGATGARDGGW